MGASDGREELADRLDLEVEGDEGKDEALQVLDEVVEHL